MKSQKKMWDKRWKVFSPQLCYIILLWNSIKFCNFTGRVSGELTKIHQISPLTTNYQPCSGSNLSHPACQRLLLPLCRRSLTSRICYLNLNKFTLIPEKHVRWIFERSAISSVESTCFSVEKWYFFVKSPLTLMVKLHKLTAQKKCQKDVRLRGGGGVKSSNSSLTPHYPPYLTPFYPAEATP